MEAGPKLSSTGETMKPSLAKRILTSIAYMLVCFGTLLVFPRPSFAQKIGQVACAQRDDQVSLYTSMVTLEIRATLKCGQQVQVLNRYDNFFQVRTDSGQTGFVPVESIRFVKSAGNN